MSQLLKNIYVNGPSTHFPEASHVLPIVILDQTIKGDLQSSRLSQAFSSRASYENRKAFFYQFKDNHIYNFDFEGTFIEELLDNGCILEMCKQGNMNKDESFDMSTSNMGIYSGQSSIEASQQSQFGGQRHKTIPSQTEKVKTVTGEMYKHIIYYPIFDVQDESKIIAIFEVAYKKKLEQTEYLLTDEIQQYLDQFRSQLCQFRVRLNSFSRNLENVFLRKLQKKES